MARVFIPPLLRSLTEGQETVEVSGGTVAELVDALDRRFPGVKSRLIDGDRVKAGLSIGIGAKLAVRGLSSKVNSEDEVHFLPAIGGG